MLDGHQGRAAAARPTIEPMYTTALILHLIAATVWTGGHLVLATTVLPRALAARDAEILKAFERGYEKIGIPALITQVATGLWMAHLQLPPSQWFALATPQSHLIAAKLGLLALTAAFAVDARFRVIPRLNAAMLPAMAWHIWPVTLFSVLFVLVGAGFRLGWG